MAGPGAQGEDAGGQGACEREDPALQDRDLRPARDLGDPGLGQLHGVAEGEDRRGGSFRSRRHGDVEEDGGQGKARRPGQDDERDGEDKGGARGGDQARRDLAPGSGVRPALDVAGIGQAVQTPPGAPVERRGRRDLHVVSCSYRTGPQAASSSIASWESLTRKVSDPATLWSREIAAEPPTRCNRSSQM